MAGLTGSEQVFNSVHTAAEREQSIANAKSTADILAAIGLTSDQVTGLSSANSPSSDNPVATMADLPDGVTYGNTAGTACEGNDARLPTSDQKAALAGTSGTPSASNKFVTNADNRMVTGATSSVFLDCNRTDTYTADGTPDRPFKSIDDSLAYLAARGTAGVGYYATGTYTTGGGTYTLPDLPILVHGNKSTITGSSTFNIPGPYVAKNLDVDGNVNLQDGSAPHVDRLEGQTIDGSVSIGGTVTTHLDSVTITGHLSLSSGTAPVYLSPDSVIEGNITGSTSRLRQVVSVEVESVAADRVVITNEAGSFESSPVTATELGNLTGTTGNIQTQVNAEVAARAAGDVAQLKGRRFSGGRSTLVAADARAGICRYGASVLLTALAEGAGVPCDLGNATVALTDVSGPLARVQVSVVLASGTLVVRTAARVWALNIWQRLIVEIDEPVEGSIGASSVHVYIDNGAQTLETVADYSGAPVETSSAWSLGGDNAGTNLLTGRVAQWGVLNYPLSPAQVADYYATARLPYEGVGSMQLLTNGSFETFTGTVDDAASDIFPGWTNGVGLYEAVSGGQSGGYALKITATTGAIQSSHLGGLGGCTVILSFSVHNDTLNGVGYSGLRNVTDSLWVADTNGVSYILSTGALTEDWKQVVRTFVVPLGKTVSVFLYGDYYGGTKPIWYDNVKLRVLGNTLAGLDLAAQPVCSRATLGAVLLDAAAGAEVWPTTRPERMTLATQAPMTADGYLLADQIVHPAGYVVSSVLVINSGSASATVTVRAGSSSGTLLASGTVIANAAPIALTVASGGFAALFASGGKIHVSGGTTASPLAVTVILQRA